MARRSEVFLHFELYREPDRELALDYFVWVARNADRTVLVDCGFNEGSGARRSRTMLCPPVEALRRVGVGAAEVSQLIVTHGHYDHIGNLLSFPAARIVVVLSVNTDKSTVGGIEARIDGRVAKMASTVSMMFAPGTRLIMRRMAGFPLTEPAFRTSSTESVTVPMSDSRTWAPLRYASTNDRYWLALKSWSLVFKAQALSLPLMTPLAWLALAVQLVSDR